MPSLPTVQIVSEKDPTKMAIINESDFDPSKHVLWEDRDKHPAMFAKPDEMFGSAHRSEGPMSSGTSSTSFVEPKDKPSMSGNKK